MKIKLKSGYDYDDRFQDFMENCIRKKDTFICVESTNKDIFINRIQMCAENGYRIWKPMQIGHIEKHVLYSVEMRNDGKEEITL